MNAALIQDSSVVVIPLPYGEVPVNCFTGAAVSLQAADLDKRAVTSFVKALEGIGTGLQFTSGYGQPGMSPDMSIRGMMNKRPFLELISDQKCNPQPVELPLLVINGFPSWMNPAVLQPDDIESVTVLKDAVGASLFGGRSNAGVILINTKTQVGKKNFLRFKFRQGVASRELPSYEKIGLYDYYSIMLPYYETGSCLYYRNYYGFNPLNVTEFLNEDRTMKEGVRLLNPEDTKWKKELLRLANRTEAVLAGGVTHSWVAAYVSGSILREDGYLIQTGLKRITGYARLDFNPLKWLKVGATANISYATHRLRDYSKYRNGYSGPKIIGMSPFDAINLLAPDVSIHHYNPEGEIAKDKNGGLLYAYPPCLAGNAVEGVKNGSNRWKDEEQQYQFFAEVLPFRGFSIRLQGGWERLWNERKGKSCYQRGIWSPDYTTKQYLKDSVHSERKSRVVDMWLTYRRQIRDHEVGIAIGHNRYLQEYNMEDYYEIKNVSIGGDNYKDDIKEFAWYNFLWPDSGSTKPEFVHNLWEEKSWKEMTERFWGYKVVADYNYKKKYILMASWIKDHYKPKGWPLVKKDFYTVGIAWNILQEGWLKGYSWLKELEWRASWGKGHNLESRCSWIAPGIGESGNTDMFSVKTIQKDIALDFNLWNRLKGTLGYYNKRVYERWPEEMRVQTSNLIKSFVGAVNQKVNNRGWEIALQIVPVQLQQFHWELGVNMTFPHNKVLGINPVGKNATLLYNPDERKNKPINAFFMPHFLGADPATGKALYLGKENVPVTELSHAVYGYAGSPLPDFYGTFSQRFQWRHLTLSCMFAFSCGGKVYDQTYQKLMTPWPGYGLHPDILARWQMPGDQTHIPVLDRYDINARMDDSDRWLTDASYFSMKSFVLSWDLPVKWLHKIRLKEGNIYLNGENLFLLSARKGMDPQQSFDGYIYNLYGPARSFSIGFSVAI